MLVIQQFLVVDLYLLKRPQVFLQLVVDTDIRGFYRFSDGIHQERTVATQYGLGDAVTALATAHGIEFLLKQNIVSHIKG